MLLQLDLVVAGVSVGEFGAGSLVVIESERPEHCSAGSGIRLGRLESGSSVF